MFANTKSKSSLFRVAVLSLLAAGCTRRKAKVEEILIDEVLVTTGQGKTTFSLDNKQETSLRELVKSLGLVKEVESDDGHKHHIVVYVYNTSSGSKSTNRMVSRQRANEAVRILHSYGYDGQVNFIFTSADTPGLKFSISSAGLGLPLPEALDRQFGPEHKHAASAKAKAKPQAKPKVVDHKDDEEDDEGKA